jgi:hypothetical protein
MTLLQRIAGTACGAAAAFALAAASTAPVTVHESGDAVLRLAWSARPERIEDCRPRSAEELAALPPHMRQPLVCEGVAAQYRLTVRRGGAVVADQIVRGGGLRHDRRLYVFHEIALPPGEIAVEVRFDRIDPDTPNRSAGSAPSTATVPPHLSLERRLSFRPREVVLVTYDAQRRTLVAVGGSSR